MREKSWNRKWKLFTFCMAAVLLAAMLPGHKVQAASKIKGFDVSSKNGVIVLKNRLKQVR